jgi:hypothetical protein
MHFQKETVDEGWIKNPSLTLEKMGYSNLFLTRSYLIQEEGTCGILENKKILMSTSVPSDFVIVTVFLVILTN